MAKQSKTDRFNQCLEDLVLVIKVSEQAGFSFDEIIEAADAAESMESMVATIQRVFRDFYEVQCLINPRFSVAQFPGKSKRESRNTPSVDQAPHSCTECGRFVNSLPLNKFHECRKCGAILCPISLKPDMELECIA